MTDMQEDTKIRITPSDPSPTHFTAWRKLPALRGNASNRSNRMD
jgi:hypothetical protein